MNYLYYGDALEILSKKAEHSVDLIYLDPPFNSNRAYNAIYKTETGHPLPDQVSAFCDTWEMDSQRQQAITDLPARLLAIGKADAQDKWQSLVAFLREHDTQMLAYISYMAERVIEVYRVLKPTGSLYYHCDSTASHYIKLMLDMLFGKNGFRNEIVWHYKAMSNAKRHYCKKHDTILFYSKSDKWTFNADAIRQPYDEKTIARYEKEVQFPGGYQAKIHEDGKLCEDVFVIPPIRNVSKEKVGYPTQKPLALLERIIKASSNEGDVVLDPFCGCATTMVAAHQLKRKWIGIDIAYHAIHKVVRDRLGEVCGLAEGKDYEVSGVPKNKAAAIQLWKKDPFQFQRWAVEQVGGFVMEKKSKDGGVDGRMYFEQEDKEALKKGQRFKVMILKVKGNKGISIKVIRELKGILMSHPNKYQMGGLIIRDPLSTQQRRSFLEEMAGVPSIAIGNKTYPAMQVLSLDDLFKGILFETPFPQAKARSQHAFWQIQSTF